MIFEFIEFLIQPFQQLGHSRNNMFRLDFVEKREFEFLQQWISLRGNATGFLRTGEKKKLKRGMYI